MSVPVLIGRQESYLAAWQSVGLPITCFSVSVWDLIWLPISPLAFRTLISPSKERIRNLAFFSCFFSFRFSPLSTELCDGDKNNAYTRTFFFFFFYFCIFSGFFPPIAYSSSSSFSTPLPPPNFALYEEAPAVMLRDAVILYLKPMRLEAYSHTFLARDTGFFSYSVVFFMCLCYTSLP